MKHLRVMGILALLLNAIACGDDGDESGGTAGQGGGGGVSGADESGGSGGDDGGGSGGTTATGGSGGASGGGGSSDTGGSGGSDAGDGSEANVGVCGQRGRATANATTFTGYEELYVIADEGFGEDICVVRFETARVGEAPEGCDDPTADIDCLWTHMVELSKPMIMTDIDGACAKSGFGLDAEAIAEVDGSQAAYGYVSEFAGHNGVVLRYDEAMDDWSPYGNGTWDEDTDMFRFDHRDGLCDY